MLNNNETQATDLQIFHFGGNEGTPFRVQLINDEPYFVGKDLCQILGFSKYRDVLASLDEDERVSIFVDTLGGKQSMTAVNESGFYHLVFKSSHPKAAEFRRKVTMEILPTLRRTGRYEVKPQRWSQRYERPKDVVDMRAVMYEHSKFDGHPIRAVRYDGSIVYSVADMLRAMKVGTSAYQAVASLVRAGMYVVKIHFCGSPHPTWCTTHLGLLMLLRSTRNPDLCQRKFDFSSVQ